MRDSSRARAARRDFDQGLALGLAQVRDEAPVEHGHAAVGGEQQVAAVQVAVEGRGFAARPEGTGEQAADEGTAEAAGLAHGQCGVAELGAVDALHRGQRGRAPGQQRGDEDVGVVGEQPRGGAQVGLFAVEADLLHEQAAGGGEVAAVVDGGQAELRAPVLEEVAERGQDGELLGQPVGDAGLEHLEHAVVAAPALPPREGQHHCDAALGERAVGQVQAVVGPELGVDVGVQGIDAPCLRAGIRAPAGGGAARRRGRAGAQPPGRACAAWDSARAGR